jgi:hypothetical protein
MDLSNPIKPWEEIIWKPEPIFNRESVFVVASGPSLTQEIANKLGGRRVIAVNSSAKLLPFADVLYFTDSGWYDTNREFVKAWPGLIVSMSRQAKRELDDPAVNPGPPRVLRVKGIGDPNWPPRLPGMPKRLGFPPLGTLWQGRNSGNTAVSLAIAMGATRVYLVAFDCRVVNGREHFHSEYKGPRDLSLYDNEFKVAFNGWNEAALNSGVEIFNCTDGSAITEFPFIDLEDLLNGDLH